MCRMDNNVLQNFIRLLSSLHPRCKDMCQLWNNNLLLDEKSTVMPLTENIQSKVKSGFLKKKSYINLVVLLTKHIASYVGNAKFD